MLAFHGGVPGFDGGYVGVDVFFVISGFLITGLMMRDAERGTSRSRQLADFYARRVRRILPAAAIVTVATLLGSFVLLNGVETMRAIGDAKSTALFYSNHHFVGSSDYFFAPNGPSLFQQYWSLSVEEQFYAVWPLLFLGFAAMGGARFRRRSIAVGALVASVASFVISVVWTSDTAWLSRGPSNGFYLLPSRAWELGVGVLLALGASRAGRMPRRLRAPLAAVGGLAILAAVVLFDDATRFPGVAALLPTLGTAAVIAAGIGAAIPSPVNGALSTGVAQWIGRYSYALYLVHWPVLLLIVERSSSLNDNWPLRALTMTAITVPASMALYHLVENPVRRSRGLREPRPALALGAALVLVTVAATAVVTPPTRHSLSTARMATPLPLSDLPSVAPTDFVPKNLEPSLEDVAINQLSSGDGCPRDCVVGDPSGDYRVTVIGDSIAEQLLPALESLASGFGWRLHERILRGCPVFEDLRGTECARFHGATIASFREAPPDLVILASRQDRAYASSTTAFLTRIDTTLASLPDQSKAVVVGATPFSRVDIPRCLAEHLRATQRCDQVWPAEINAAMASAVQAAGGTFLDLRPVLCESVRCPAISGSRLIWADRDHLTAQYARWISPWLRTQFAPLVAN